VGDFTHPHSEKWLAVNKLGDALVMAADSLRAAPFADNHLKVHNFFEKFCTFNFSPYICSPK